MRRLLETEERGVTAPVPRITFGMIVLNGEPFIRYNLRSLYPFAHQIIVVEGASPSAAGIATSDGHSTDATLESLRRFREDEDPEGKVILVTAEEEGHPNGFWPGEKDEQSRAYARRATGEYLWQVDVDEFYLPHDMEKTIGLLSAQDGDLAVSFHMITFWGGLGYLTDGWYLRRGAATYHRLFRWRKGYRYATHRPPTVVNDQGIDIRSIRYLDGQALFREHGIRLHHYSLLFPKQVREKCLYYAHAYPRERREAERWAVENFEKLSDPYRVHNVYAEPSWLERFVGDHPPQVHRMMEDIRDGVVDAECRKNEDVERILGSAKYRAGRAVLKWVLPLRTKRDEGRRLVRRMTRRLGLR